MRRRRRSTLVLVALTTLLVAGCSSDAGEGASRAEPSGAVSPTRRTDPVEPTTTASRAALPPDPRWLFFTDDRTRYRSPWFPGRHRVMIEYGCTDAPFYEPDARCDGGGFHHGVDVALPCGTPLLSGVRGRVVTPAPATVGPAYGRRPLLLRTTVEGRPADVLLGHARRLLVQVGDGVAPGDPVAVTGASAAPDGCHLHLELREPGGGVATARDPDPVLRLR